MSRNTLTVLEADAMRDLLVPLRSLIAAANPGREVPPEDIFFHVALPLLTHIRPTLDSLALAISLWTATLPPAQLTSVTDGHWDRMGPYAVLTVRFGIREETTISTRSGPLDQTVYWSQHLLSVMQLTPRVTLLVSGFSSPLETYTESLSRLYPAVDWHTVGRPTSTGSRTTSS